MDGGALVRFVVEALAWLVDPANMVGPTGWLVRLGEHLVISALVVAIASFIAIPLGWYIGHTGRGRFLAVSASGAVRALPTLGLLTLVSLTLGIGLAAPVIALVVLAIPPLLAGAYSGVEAADRDAVDGGHAVGMTDLGVLWNIEIPLGTPLLVAGLRSAALQVIATATLAAYTGAGGLGRYLFLGLKTQDYAVMVAGSILVIGLAVVVDGLFALLQKLVTPTT